MTLGLGGTRRLGTRTHTRECTRVPSFREFSRHTGRRSEGEKKKRRAKAGCSRRIVPRSMVRNAPRPFARANVSPRHPAAALPSSISARLVARNRVYVFALALVLTLMLTTRTCTHGGPCATSSAPTTGFCRFVSIPLRRRPSLVALPRTARIFTVVFQGLNFETRLSFFSVPPRAAGRLEPISFDRLRRTTYLRRTLRGGD